MFTSILFKRILVAMIPAFLLTSFAVAQEKQSPTRSVETAVAVAPDPLSGASGKRCGKQEG